MTEAEKFYRDRGHQRVTPEQLEALGAKRNANGIWRFKDGSYGEIIKPREVRAEGKLHPVDALYFEIADKSDPRI
jgi:hypothetical protein